MDATNRACGFELEVKNKSWLVPILRDPTFKPLEISGYVGVCRLRESGWGLVLRHETFSA